MKMQSFMATVWGLVVMIWIGVGHSHAIDQVRAADFIDLRGRTSLSDSEAQELIKKPWNAIFLNDVTDISDVAIASLATRKGTLVLPGLSQVSPVAARALGDHEGTLNLGLTSPADEIVAHLARHKGELGLNRLTDLSPGAAKSLGAGHEGVLGLNGLATISDAAAVALSAHRGVLALMGLRSISPESALALAACEYPVYLPGSNAFSQDVRERLSQHHGRILLSGLDLPQKFNPDAGWLANETVNQFIPQVVDGVLGATDERENIDSLSGVRLGSRLEDFLPAGDEPNGFPDDPSLLIVPAPDDDTDTPQNPTAVRVDAVTGTVVAVEKIFQNTPLDRIASALVERFGKPVSQPDERIFITPGGRRTVATLHYTYANAIARVVSIETDGPRAAAAPTIIVSIYSRDWVTANCVAFTNCLVVACEWARRATELFDGHGFDVKRLPPLPGTERRAVAEGTQAIYVDVHRDMLNTRIKNLAGDTEEGEVSPAVDSIVACVGVVKTGGIDDALPVVIVNPGVSSVGGLGTLMTRDPFGRSRDIVSTRAYDTIRDIANGVVQQAFPPQTDKIRVFRTQDVAGLAKRALSDSVLGGRGGVAQINHRFDLSEGHRYEWQAEGGWTVRVGFDGSICLFLQKQGKALSVD
jgi:hypothetical protein